jgi:hypothetical protein
MKGKRNAFRGCFSAVSYRNGRELWKAWEGESVVFAKGTVKS